MKCSWRWWHDGYDVQLPSLEPWFDSRRGQIHSLIAKLACRNDGGGGSQLSSLLQNGGSWGCGNIRAGVCWHTVEDELWFFRNAHVWICWKWGTWEQIGYHENILLRTDRGRRGRDKKPNSVGGRGEAETESLILWLVVLKLLARGWWWGEAQSLIQGLLETHILYTWLWDRQPWRWVRLSDWVKETHCCKIGMEIYFYLVLWFFIFYLLFIIFYELNFFRIAKWWWLPWVSAVDLVGESPRAPIAEAPATFGERWGRVGRMMTREWSVSLRVCGI